MRRPWRHGAGRRSLFPRLLLILALAGLAINMLVANYFRLTARGPMRDLVHRNMLAYLDYAVKEMGVPPDPAKAGAFAARSGFDIAFEGPLGRLATRDGLGSLQEYRRLCSNGRDVAWSRHGLVLLKPTPKGDFAFVTNPHTRVENQEYLLAGLIVGVILVVVAAGWSVRRQLEPLKDLEAGMILAGQGNLDARVAPRRDDELGRLAQSFNAMAARLKALLESRRQLLLAVSHELRTPITRMKLGLEELKDREAAASLAEDVEELGAMVSEILEGEAVQAGALHLQKVDLAGLAREVAAELAFRKPGIQTTGLPPSLEGDCDPERLAGALRNVLDNALKYSGESAPKVELSLGLVEGRPEFAVRDFGPGVPEAERAKVFEPFYRVDASRSRKTGGYGLGLSLVKTIMEAHGGSASIEAALGGGCLVRLKL